MSLNYCVLVTRDAGPSSAFVEIEAALRDGGNEVVSYLGNGKEFDPTPMEAAIAEASWVIVGLSSSADRVAEEQFAVQVAKKHGIPIAVFSDIYGAYHRAWCRDVVEAANVLFVTAKEEIDVAKKYAPNAEIVASGNPYWATFGTVPYPRDTVREKLGVSADEVLVLVSGSKELYRNMGLYGDVLKASAYIIEPKLRFVLTAHPGANHPKEVYADLLKWSKHPFVLDTKPGGMSTQELIAGADLVVTGGGSTISIMAACQGVPCVDHMSMFDRLWWESLSGSPLWVPVQSGLSVGSNSENDLFNVLRERPTRNVTGRTIDPNTFREASKIIASTLTKG